MANALGRCSSAAAASPLASAVEHASFICHTPEPCVDRLSRVLPTDLQGNWGRSLHSVLSATR